MNMLSDNSRFVERFLKTLEALESGDRISRRGAIYILGEFMQNQGEHRAILIECLCDFIRNKIDPKDNRADSTEIDIQAALSVIGRYTREDNDVDTKKYKPSSGEAIMGYCPGFKKLGEAKISNYNLSQRDYSFAVFVNSTLENVQAIETKFYHAFFRGANLAGANLSRADLRGADLRGANFTGARLVGVDLTDNVPELGGLWRFDNAIFSDAVYRVDGKAMTKFPEGFDPQAHGMKEEK